MDLSERAHLEHAAPVLAFSPHPLQAAKDRDLVYAEFLRGETIWAYLVRTGIAARMGRQPFVLTIDGRRLPRSLWAHCRPRPGTLIGLHAVVRGGGGGKNPLATIAMIALIAYSGGAATALLGAQTAGTAAFGSLTYGAIATGALVVAGGLAINRIFPPPRPDLSRAQNLGQESPTFSVSHASNRARPYEPMPHVVGKHRIFPDKGAREFTEFAGEDQVLNCVFNLGYGPMVLSEQRIGDTPLASYSGVEYEESGTDGRLTLFPGNVDTLAGGALTAAAGWVQRTSSPAATALSIEVTGSLFQVAENGELADHTVVIEINYRLVGAAGWTALAFADDSLPAKVVPAVPTDEFGNPDPTWSYLRMRAEEYNALLADPLPAGQLRVRSNRRAPLRRTYRFNVPSGQYEVRVRRVTADDTEQKKISELVWSQLRAYQPDTADYSGQKRIALRIRASGQLQGVIDQFNCVASALIQTWNGAAWVLAETSNPAWQVLDAARGKFVNGKRVWGGGLADARIDLEGLKAFGAWCTAQGLTFDWVFDQQMSVFDVISAIALMGRATPSWGTGKLGVVWDAPDQQHVAVFGMHNILPGSFEIDYATEELAEVIEGWFVNPELGWQRDFVRANVPGAAGSARTRRVELVGCNNKVLAGEHTNLYAANNAYRARRYRWTNDWEGMPASRGDVVLLSHDLASLDYSGRFIEGGNAGTLKLPKKVPLYAGGSFVLIVKPNREFKAFAVQGGAGESDTLTLVTPLAGGDAAYNPWGDPNKSPYDFRWHYGPTATPGKKVKIEAFKPLSLRQVQIAAIDERPEYYASKTNPVVSTTPRPVFGTALISDLQLTEEGVRAAQGYLVEVTVTWTPGSDYSHADVYAALNDGPLERYATVRSSSYAFSVSDGTKVRVEVTVHSSLQRLGGTAKAVAEKTIAFAALFPPSDVAAFGLDGNSFRWPGVPDVDVVGYRIRFQYGENLSFGDAKPLHEGLLASSPSDFRTLPAGRVTFFLTAVDAAKRESVNPAIIIKDLGDPALANVVEQVDFKTLSWPGTLTGGAEVGAQLVANGTTDFYGPDASAFYAADANPFYEDEVYSTMVYETDIFYFSNDWIGSDIVLEHAIAGEAVKIEFRRTNEESFYGADADAFYGADADSFYGKSGQYLPWPGTVTFVGGDYQLRVTTGGSPIQGVISELAVVIDVPDLVEELQNVAIAPGGTRLALTKPFKAVKTIQLTLEDDGGAAVSARYIDKDLALGPLVEAIDAAQVSVAGHVDATIKGR